MKKIAVIGTGVMGYRHVRVLKDLERDLKNFELIAISDSNKQRLEQVAKEFQIENIYENHIQLLNSESLDGAIIAVPPEFHKDITLDCINKKVNVLVEKPMARTIKDADLMINAAKENNVLLSVGHIERFNPVVQEIKKLLTIDKIVTNIYLTKTTRIGAFPKRLLNQKVGVLLDLAVHDSDIINYLVGKIDKVKSQIIYSNSQEVYANILFKTVNNVHGSSEYSWITPRKERTIEIFGPEGLLKGDYASQKLFFYENGDFFSDLNPDNYHKEILLKGMICSGKVIEYPIVSKEPLKSELENFICSIDNPSNIQVTGYSGREALEVILKIKANRIKL